MRELADREDALPGNVIRDDARLSDDVAPVLPTTAIGRGTISDSRNPQAGELLPEDVYFHDDPDWEHSTFPLAILHCLPGSSLTPDGDTYAERFANYSRMRVPPLWWRRNAC